MIPKGAVNVISSFWPILAMFSIVLITLRLFYIKINKKPFVLYKELLSLTFILYILLLFELVTSTDFYSYSNSFIPFKEMFRYKLFSPLFIRNVLGNIIIFIPFGYFTSYYVKINKMYLSLLITLITSLSIEVIQSIIGRSFDIDDIILNVLGGVTGYFLYKISSLIVKKFSIKIKNNIVVNLLFIVIIIVLIYVVFLLYGVYL